MSITALEVMMQQKEYGIKLERWAREYNHHLFNPLMNLIYKRTFLQRPYTDDMFQMLDDLGIDWPVKSPISYDGLTFRWK